MFENVLIGYRTRSHLERIVKESRKVRAMGVSEEAETPRDPAATPGLQVENISQFLNR